MTPRRSCLGAIHRMSNSVAYGPRRLEIASDRALRMRGLLDQQRDGRNESRDRDHREDAAEAEVQTRELRDEERSRDAAEAPDAEHPRDARAASLRRIER